MVGEVSDLPWYQEAATCRSQEMNTQRWPQKVMGLTFGGVGRGRLSKQHPQEINLQINFIIQLSLVARAKISPNSKSCQWPTQARSYALFYPALSLWDYTSLITTAPLRTAGILRCTHEAEFLMLSERGLHWCGSWSARQGSDLETRVNLRVQTESQGLLAGTGACLHVGAVSLTQMPSVFTGLSLDHHASAEKGKRNPEIHC